MHQISEMIIDRFNKTIEELKEDFRKEVELNDKLKQQNAELQGTNYKDAEMAAMKQQLEQVRKNAHRGFSISEAEAKAVSEWQSRHREKYHNNKPSPSAIGGNWIYKFVPTSIGVFGSCSCKSCKYNAKKEFYSWLYGNNYDIKTERAQEQKREELKRKYDYEFDFQEEAP